MTNGPHEHKFKSLLEHAQRITFAELITTIAVAVLLVAIFMLHEARTAFIQQYVTMDSDTTGVPTATSLTLSPSSVDQVRDFATANTTLSSVAVVGVDLSENSRTVLVSLHNGTPVKKNTAEGKATVGVAFPLFSHETENNADVSTLLNGEFTCVNSPPADLLGSAARASQVCRVPVPPYYGRLTGYLIMHTTKELSIYEIDKLRAAAFRLALQIYRTDVLRASRYERLQRSY